MKHPTKTSSLHVHLATCPQKKSIDLRHNSSLGLSGLSSFFPTKWDSKTIFAPPLRQSDPPLLSELAFQLLQGEGLEAQRVVIQVIDIYSMFGDDEHWVYHIIVLSFKIFGQSKIYFFGSYTSLSLIWFPLIFTDRSTNSTIWQTNMTGRLYPIVRFSNPPIPQSGQFMFEYRRVHSLISYYPLSSFIFHSNSINISFIQPMDFTLNFSVTHRSNFSDLRLLSAHELITHLLINSMQGTRQLNTVSRAMF